MSGRVTLAQLRLLVAVVDAGGFSQPAAELGMSQGTLSEAVASLERLVGQPLLRRTREGTRPTPAGERALEHARRALGAAEDFVQATLEPSELQGELRIISMRSAATHLLPPAIRAFTRAHADVRVRMQDADQERDGGVKALLDGRADVGILPLPVPSGFLAHPLLHDAYVAIAPATRGAQPLEWDELRGAPLILNCGGFSCLDRVLAYLEAAGVQPGPVEQVQEDSVILSMVGYGLGLTIMPRLAAEPLPAGLIALSLPVPLSRTLAVVSLASRASLPVIGAFTRTLRAGVAQLGPGTLASS